MKYTLSRQIIHILCGLFCCFFLLQLFACSSSPFLGAFNARALADNLQNESLQTGNSQTGNSQTGNSQIGNSQTGNSQTGNSQIGNSQTIEYDLPIIMYHGVFPRMPNAYRITPKQFESDLIYINENGYTPIVFADLIRYVDFGTALPKKPIMLTFDDGLLDNYKYAFPLLKKYNAKGVFAVVGKYIDQNYDENGQPTPSFSNFNYEELCEMAKSGYAEIQNHTYDLHKNKGAFKGICKGYKESNEEYEKRLTEDLMKLNYNLYEKCGINCTAVAFPFGAYSSQAIEIIKKLGFRASLTCNEGINHIRRDSDLFLLKRLNRSCKYSTDSFFGKKIEGK